MLKLNVKPALLLLEDSKIAAVKGELKKCIKKFHGSPPGFVRILYDDRVVREIEEYSEKLKKYENFVVVGIGGSALGNQALQNALRPMDWNFLTSKDREGYCRVFVIDNVDPDLVRAALKMVEPEKTIFNIISKSGGTAEALANYLIVRGVLEDAGLDPRNHLVFTTDPKKGFLRELASREGIDAFEIPPDVGGRFSVLTSVGLLSAKAAGVDIRALLEGARNMVDNSKLEEVNENLPALLALVHYLHLEQGRNITVMMAYSNRLLTLVDWFRQLWAESLGKRKDGQCGVGQTPVKALGSVDQHSQLQLYNDGPDDKIITMLRIREFHDDVEIPLIHDDESVRYLGGKKLSELLNTEFVGTALSLVESNRPVVILDFEKLDEEHVGQFFLLYEIATVFMGELLGVNPFDQPGVERSKVITKALMGMKGLEKEKAKILARLKELEMEA